MLYVILALRAAHLPRFVYLIAALCLLSAGCREHGQHPNLHDRITAANTSKYCLPDACFNPHVLAVESGYVVTIFLGSKPQHTNVPPKELTKYLQSLPCQRGRVDPQSKLAQPMYSRINMRLNETSVVRSRFAIRWGLRCKSDRAVERASKYAAQSKNQRSAKHSLGLPRVRLGTQKETPICVLQSGFLR